MKQGTPPLDEPAENEAGSKEAGSAEKLEDDGACRPARPAVRRPF